MIKSTVGFLRGKINNRGVGMRPRKWVNFPKKNNLGGAIIRDSRVLQSCRDVKCARFSKILNSIYCLIIRVHNTVKPNLKGLAGLLRFRDCFGLKKVKIKKRKILGLTYLSVHPID